MPVRRLGRAYCSTSDDGLVCGVVGVCESCAKISTRSLGQSLERALRDPERYFVKLYADIGTAELAVALLGHPDYVDAALVALGWRDEKCRGKIAGSNRQEWETLNPFSE
jgi:hypothetical protein